MKYLYSVDLSSDAIFSSYAALRLGLVGVIGLMRFLRFIRFMSFFEGAKMLYFGKYCTFSCFVCFLPTFFDFNHVELRRISCSES